MFTGWMIIGMVIGAAATVLVWALIAAVLMAKVEDRHHPSKT